MSLERCESIFHAMMRDIDDDKYWPGVKPTVDDFVRFYERVVDDTLSNYHDRLPDYFIEEWAKTSLQQKVLEAAPGLTIKNANQLIELIWETASCITFNSSYYWIHG